MGKNDIMEHFGNKNTDIRVVLNPIVTDQTKTDFNIVSEKYQIKESDYFLYCHLC